MSTIEALPPSALDERSEFEYRPLSVWAVVSLVLGIFSGLIFFAGRDGLEGVLWMTPFPLLGIALGWRALKAIRNSSGQYSGASAAKVGLALSAACLVGGVSFASYVHSTEVPSGYERTTFTDLKPDEVELRGDHLIPPDIAALEGQRIFIKGYMRPGTHYSAGGSAVSQNIKKFLLVRDNNQCCFGDISTVQYFDQIQVSLGDRLTADYSPRLFRIGGTLHIHRERLVPGSQQLVYSLEADHAE